MIYNKGVLKQRIAKRDILLGGCVMDCRSGAVIEAYHDSGYDFVMIDREHTALNSETILEHLRIARALGIPTMVRAAELSYHEICRNLDQLPDGIFVPRIRSRQDVEELMQIVKYPPFGKRGVGASTCPAGRYMGWDHVSDMVETLTNDTVIGIQIETKEALENLDDILSVPGLDVAVVGNDDLSTGMGIPGQFYSDTYRDAVKRVIERCNHYNVMPGIAAGAPELVEYWAGQGMKMFWAASDICLLWQGAKQNCAALHQVLKLKPGQPA